MDLTNPLAEKRRLRVCATPELLRVWRRTRLLLILLLIFPTIRNSRTSGWRKKRAGGNRSSRSRRNSSASASNEARSCHPVVSAGVCGQVANELTATLAGSLAERAEEQQREANERERIRLERQAECDRIARLEQQESNTIERIETQLRNVGAVCAGELELQKQDALPLSVAVLTLNALEVSIAIAGDSGSIALVADASGLLHAYALESRTLLFSVCFGSAQGLAFLQHPSAMVRKKRVSKGEAVESANDLPGAELCELWILLSCLSVGHSIRVLDQ